jgi:hypothetical protein
MIIRLLLSASFLLVTYSHSYPQDTGKKEFPELGISFTIPDGYYGQLSEDLYIIGSETFRGFIVLSTTEENELAELRAEVRKGISEGFSTKLSLQGNIDEISSNSIGAELRGTLEGQKAAAYIIGIVNKAGPYGLTIFTATEEAAWSDDVKNLAMQIASSVVFSKVAEPTVDEAWEKSLTNVRLTYMSSYSSGLSGGSSSRSTIDLCGNKTFSYASSSSISVDVGGAFGSSSGNNSGNGTWQVINRQQQPVLVLNFTDGRVWEYNLEFRDQKYYLNGTRYFYTTQADGREFGPNCY